jgi:hypothetical protein
MSRANQPGVLVFGRIFTAVLQLARLKPPKSNLERLFRHG